MPKRTLAFFTALLFAFSGLLARLYQLATSGYDAVVDGQSTLTVTVATARGTLYDRNGTALTNTRTRYAAAVTGQPAALAALSSSVGYAAWEESLKSGKPLVLTDELSFPIADGILQFTVPERYDDSGLAAHVIGYLDDDGIHGACGAEAALDEHLNATSGQLRVTYQTDGTGAVLAGGEVTVENTLDAAKAGAALTLDKPLQTAVEVLGGERISRGAAVIMDIASGDILALASYPSFSATRLSEYLYDSDSPLFNRATALYNCGSVFKIATAMAALEGGVAESLAYPCLGVLQVGGNRIKCHHVLGHGTLTLKEAFAQSCNPYFIQLAQQMGGATLYRYASLLGFDSPLLLMDGWRTERATLPTAESLGSAVALANLSIGQGDLLATPLHITAMTACVAADGVYRRPNLYFGSVDSSGTVTAQRRDPATTVCSSETAATLREQMCAVIADGTGKAAAPAWGTAGGKTGTAETGWSTADGTGTMVQGWFTGFYPAEQPQYAITVLAEDSGTTKESAAEVFKVFCDTLYRMGYVKIPLDKDGADAVQ